MSRTTPNPKGEIRLQPNGAWELRCPQCGKWGDKFGPFPIRFRPALGREGELPELELGFVTVEVDPASLADALGPRALRSKGGKSTEASGLVVVRRCPKPIRHASPTAPAGVSTPNLQ